MKKNSKIDKVEARKLPLSRQTMRLLDKLEVVAVVGAATATNCTCETN